MPADSQVPHWSPNQALSFPNIAQTTQNRLMKFKRANHANKIFTGDSTAIVILVTQSLAQNYTTTLNFLH